LLKNLAFSGGGGEKNLPKKTKKRNLCITRMYLWGKKKAKKNPWIQTKLCSWRLFMLRNKDI